MAKVTLRYTTTPLTVFPYDGVATEQEEFITTIYHDPLPLTSPIQTNLLSGRKVTHPGFTHLQYDFEISADEIPDAIKTFLIAFWQAPHKYISTNSGTVAVPIWSDYKEVQLPAGLIPLSYLQDLDVLPEITLQLTTVLAE